MLVISNKSWSQLFWRKRDDRFLWWLRSGNEMGFALHLVKRRKVSEGILWSYWSLWKQKPNRSPSLSVFLMLYTVNLLDRVLGFLFNRTENQCFTFITKCEKQIMWKVCIHSLGCKTHLSVHVMWWVGKWSELFDYNEFVWLKRLKTSLPTCISYGL